jgi:hypothetical protein
VTTYLQARAAGGGHAIALEAVLHSYSALSKEKQEHVWYRFQHRHDASVNAFADLCSPPSNDGDLAELIFSMMWEAKGPFDDTVVTWITDQISLVIFDLKERYSVRWD